MIVRRLLARRIARMQLKCNVCGFVLNTPEHIVHGTHTNVKRIDFAGQSHVAVIRRTRGREPWTNAPHIQTNRDATGGERCRKDLRVGAALTTARREVGDTGRDRVREFGAHGEGAARSALQKRAVDVAEAFSHFGPQEKELRNRLRARGRQVGDLRSADKTQSIDQLIQELAYEYWHRMLFARFLAENEFLIEPAS